MELLALPLDLTSKLSCRDSFLRVHDVRASGDKARPIAARVVLHDGRELNLTYPDHGQFYEGFEQPIDLIGETTNV